MNKIGVMVTVAAAVVAVRLVGVGTPAVDVSLAGMDVYGGRSVSSVGGGIIEPCIWPKCSRN